MNAIEEVVLGKGFSAKVIRTNRIKTATVKVVEGEVSVVVPKMLSCASVQTLIGKKTGWINEKLLLQKRQLPNKPKEYVSGECFQYLGKNYRLKVLKGPEQPVKLIGGKLLVQVPEGSKSSPNAIRGALERWYISRAWVKLDEKARRYSKLLRVSPNSVDVKGFKAQWGSCTLRGDIRYNWKIVIAPNRIVDYVVAHELCHLLHHDHGPQFWKALGREIPDYKECRDWLKVNGRHLAV